MLDIPADRDQRVAPSPGRPLPTNFVETATPEISVAELLARVQDEVARRKVDSSGSLLGTGRRSRSCLDWALISTQLRLAEENAPVGEKVPSMNRFPGPVRIVARLLGSGVLYLLRIITNPQREFNQATLVALRALQEGIRQLEKTNQQALSELKERHIEEIRTALRDQERRLDLFLDEARRKAS